MLVRKIHISHQFSLQFLLAGNRLFWKQTGVTSAWRKKKSVHAWKREHGKPVNLKMSLTVNWDSVASQKEVPGFGPVLLCGASPCDRVGFLFLCARPILAAKINPESWDLYFLVKVIKTVNTPDNEDRMAEPVQEINLYMLRQSIWLEDSLKNIKVFCS